MILSNPKFPYNYIPIYLHQAFRFIHISASCCIYIYARHTFLTFVHRSEMNENGQKSGFFLPVFSKKRKRDSLKHNKKICRKTSFFNRSFYVYWFSKIMYCPSVSGQGNFIIG